MENKTGKYLKYAIGEIILVVIGILIALQINNWNDQRKAKVVTHLYYKQLLEDFEKDKNYIEETSTVIDSHLIRFNAYKALYNEPGLTLREATKGLGMIKSGIEPIDFSTNTITILQNTGDIKLIPSHIKNKLIDLQKGKDKVVKSSDINNIAVLEFWNSAKELYGNPSFNQRIQNQAEFLKYRPNDETEIKVLRIYEASFELKHNAERGVLNKFDKIQKQIDEITKLINDELDE